MSSSQIHDSRKTIVSIITSSAFVMALGGCASSPEQEVVQAQPKQSWSSKSESVRGAASPAVRLNATVDVPATLASGSVTQLREPAISILLQAAGSTNPLLRANAIEALQPAPEQLSQVIRQCLGDENRGVRFVAAMTVGRLQLKDLAPQVEPLLHDESQSVQAAAIYGLRRCDRPADVNPLANMLLGEDPEAKGNAAMVLGELGDPSAVPMLRHAAGKGLIRTAPARRKIIDLQLAEAMVKLGAVQELEVIRAALFSTPEEGELVALACQMCGELNDGGALPNLLDLATRTGRRQESAEIRMAAARAIAQIDPSKAPVEVPAEYIASASFQLRAQAAQTLAAMSSGGDHSEQINASLVKLLKDPNAMVQVAAAGGVLRSMPTEVADGFSTR